MIHSFTCQTGNTDRSRFINGTCSNVDWWLWNTIIESSNSRHCLPSSRVINELWVNRCSSIEQTDSSFHGLNHMANVADLLGKRAAIMRLQTISFYVFRIYDWSYFTDVWRAPSFNQQMSSSVSKETKNRWQMSLVRACTICSCRPEHRSWERTWWVLLALLYRQTDRQRRDVLW
jgi:hypothetical protein